MRQIALIALIALFQTELPVPRKATDNTSQISKNGQEKAATKQTPTNTTKPNTNLADSVPKQQTSPTQATSNEDRAESVRVAPVDIHKDWADYLYILANLLLTLITLGIAIFAAIQARAAKRSADNDEKSIRLTERADILLEAASVINAYPERFDAHSRVVLRFKNFGRTRANNVVINVQLIIPNTLDIPIPEIPKIVMGAGEEQSLSFQSFGETLTQETFQKICGGSIPLKFAGRVNYDDVFGNHHMSDCSGEFNVKIRAFAKVQNNGS